MVIFNLFLFQVSGKDPFGCDPFATLQPASSRPPPRPESPSPALPPKKSKQPPPRPAPPRPLQQPTMRAAPLPPTPSPDPTAVSDAGASRDPFSNPGTQVDPFAADPFGGRVGTTPTPAAQQHDPFSNSSGAFADFTNFDSKVRLFSCTVKLNCGHLMSPFLNFCCTSLNRHIYFKGVI